MKKGKMEGRERKKLTYSRFPPPTPVFSSTINDIRVYPVTYNKNIAPREMADSRTRARKTKNELEASYGDGKKGRKRKKQAQACQKDTRINLKELSMTKVGIV